ncbi:MAG: TlpA family protein disulfide reductase [Burkholderiaceae bacterium]|nr:MAG: TlpA family protein disulfide reductase [Burkholderiaceae bacterium]MBE7426148.1 TlpA family protein disulfide reductase [Ideonella sp.]MCC7286369.1 TlpA family protein disulfide reductase [Burkholderiaceae bacterium]
MSAPFSRRAVIGITVGLAAAAAGAAVAWWRHRQGDVDVRAVDALWSMRFERPEGGTLAMANYRGKPLVINFWATWCAPCIRELPALQRFAREHAAQGWRVIALAVDQPVPVLEFIARFKLELPVAMAGIDGLEWQRAMGNRAGGLPYSVVLDPRGRVRQRRLGESHYDELVQWATEIAGSG